VRYESRSRSHLSLHFLVLDLCEARHEVGDVVVRRREHECDHELLKQIRNLPFCDVLRADLECDRACAGGGGGVSAMHERNMMHVRAWSRCGALTPIPTTTTTTTVSLHLIEYADDLLRGYCEEKQWAGQGQGKRYHGGWVWAALAAWVVSRFPNLSTDTGRGCKKRKENLRHYRQEEREVSSHRTSACNLDISLCFLIVFGCPAAPPFPSLPCVARAK
jgi:hypothetical protein